MPKNTLSIIENFSKGDDRTALNTLKMILTNGNIKENKITASLGNIKTSINHKSMIYDKDGKEHNQVASAYLKSIRNSDADSALFWLARMLEGDEEPIYILLYLINHLNMPYTSLNLLCLKIQNFLSFLLYYIIDQHLLFLYLNLYLYLYLLYKDIYLNYKKDFFLQKK